MIIIRHSHRIHTFTDPWMVDLEWDLFCILKNWYIPKKNTTSKYLRFFQHTPGTYPRPWINSLWRNSFHLGVCGCLGYAKQGFVGVLLESRIHEQHTKTRQPSRSLRWRPNGLKSRSWFHVPWTQAGKGLRSWKYTEVFWGTRMVINLYRGLPYIHKGYS